MVRATRVARYVFGVTLGTAAAASAACGLVIDADELVADRASSEDAASSADQLAPSPGDSDGGGAAVVIGCRNASGGSIPACVPAPPPGVDLVAVLWGRAGTPIPCPIGYVDVAFVGYADLEKSPPACASTGCTCNETGTPSCAARMQYFSDNACGVPTTSGTLEGTACERTDRDNLGSASPTFSVTGVTCTPSGTSPTVVDPAKFCTEMRACRPDPAATLATCPPGERATPATRNARACYRASGACAAPYVSVPSFATSPQITDTSACSCACDTKDGGCTGGSVDVWASSNGCGGATTGTLASGCRPRTDVHRSARLQANASLIPGALCTPSAKLTGAAVLPPADISLCCLPE